MPGFTPEARLKGGQVTGRQTSRLTREADAALLPIVLLLRQQKLSLRAIAAELDRRGIRPRQGRRWQARQVSRLLARADADGPLTASGVPDAPAWLLDAGKGISATAGMPPAGFKGQLVNGRAGVTALVERCRLAGVLLDCEDGQLTYSLRPYFDAAAVRELIEEVMVCERDLVALLAGEGP
jgi:hypothetical protein